MITDDTNDTCSPVCIGAHCAGNVFIVSRLLCYWTHLKR